MENIKKATHDFEEWLAQFITIVQEDLEAKHQNMASDLFIFLRATFYRWAQLFPLLCPDLQKVPEALSVADLHVLNYGTWVDLEGRPNLGINDVDEAYRLAYTNDPVRLATSANLAIETQQLKIDIEDACHAILTGYRECLLAGGQPLVLTENNMALRAMALSEQREPDRYWKKLRSQFQAQVKPPADVAQAFAKMLPENHGNFPVFTRRAGQGGLGHRRFVIIGEWKGGNIAREAKEAAPSACIWSAAEPTSKSYASNFLTEQCAATTLSSSSSATGWCAACHRIARAWSFPSFPNFAMSAYCCKPWDEMRLTSTWAQLALPKPFSKILSRRKDNWLRKAVESMTEGTRQEWKEWKQFMRR